MYHAFLRNFLHYQFFKKQLHDDYTIKKKVNLLTENNSKSCIMRLQVDSVEIFIWFS